MMRSSLALLFILIIRFGVVAQDVPVTPNDTIPTPPIYKEDSVIGFRELQEPDNVQNFEAKDPTHDPVKAALYSAILPGLGQAYNRKYWKIPVVWAGFGAFAYFINWNNDQYQFYRRNLIYEIEGNPDFPNETPYEADVLKSARDEYRRNRDMLIIFNVLYYMLNIVDAHVDAHLIEFDVNQDLSVQLQPSIQYMPVGNPTTGLTLSFRF